MVCDGCDYEFEEALKLQKSGLFFATAIGREFDGRKHFNVFMVDGDGKIVAW